MKISSLGTATLGCALALAAGSVFANVTPNLQDSSGAAVKDGSGACVVTSGQVLPECAAREGPARSGSRRSRRARRLRPRRAAPAAPAPAARPAPASVRQAVVIQADALFDFDKSVVRPDGKQEHR